jgi:hypothetical protein
MAKIVMDYDQVENICRDLRGIKESMSQAKSALAAAIEATSSSWPDGEGSNFRSKAVARVNEIGKITNYYDSVVASITTIKGKFLACEENTVV